MTPRPDNRFGSVFSILFGGLLGLSLLKFGNPAILEKMVDRPASGLEWFLNSWPDSVGYILLAGVAVFGVVSARRKPPVPRWLLFLPMVWFGWQCLAATQSVSAELSRATLFQFAACVLCFYLGVFALSPAKSIRPFFFLVTAGLLIVITVGWYQHWGGLAETRRYFFLYVYPQMPQVSPEYLKKISSNRIFSTLFYPNALAGVLLLLLPMALALIWLSSGQMTRSARAVLAALAGVAGLACMVWSGSKAGWLLMLLLGLLALFRLNFDRKWKTRLILLIFAAGMAGFGLRYAGYFKKGATSAAARADYWRAAAQTAASHPIFGTGPGTFAIPYKELKNPDSEMARLVHNDYLEQASDSGLIGFLTYAVFMVGGLWVAFQKVRNGSDWLKFSVWLGLLGWGLQGITEFGLYIPALAWAAFALLGWLLADGNEFDSAQKPPYSPAQR